MRKSTVVLGIILIFTAGVFAVPGLLDPSFNGNGIVITDFSIAGIGNYHQASSITTDRSGRTIVAGLSSAGTSLTLYEAAISRYNLDGTLDTTFNGTGKLVYDFGGDDHVVGVATDGLNRVIVGGYTNWHSGCVNKVDCGDNYNFFIGRFNEDGSVDTTFADGGRKIIGFGADDEYASDLLIDPQGRIVLAGWTDYDPGILSSSHAAIAIVRLLPGGTFDPTFGGDGTVIGDFAPDFYSAANAIAIDRNGRIVIATDVGGWPFIATMDDNGSWSSNYEAPYIAQIPWRDDCDYSQLVDVTVDQANRIIATGYCNEEDAAGTAIIVMRALPDGSFDASFGNSGVIAESFGDGAQQGRAVVVDGLGRVTIAGYVHTDACRDMFLMRVLADGSVDHSFGPNANGQAAINATGGSCSEDEAVAMTFDRQGRFMIAGHTATASGTNFAVARVLDEDPGFDFLLPVAPVTLLPGTTGTTSMTIFSIDGFNELLKIRPSAIPAGITLSFDGQGPEWQVTPPANGSATASVTVTVDATVVPGVYTISMSDDRFQDVADITINVVSSLPMAQMTVMRFADAGYIDTGAANAIQRMLQQAVDLAERGNATAATRVFGALSHYIDTQSGRHIATTATENGVTFNPALVLSQHVDSISQHVLATP